MSSQLVRVGLRSKMIYRLKTTVILNTLTVWYIPDTYLVCTWYLPGMSDMACIMYLVSTGYCDENIPGT